MPMPMPKLTAYSPNDFSPGWSLCYVAVLTALIVAGEALWVWSWM